MHILCLGCRLVCPATKGAKTKHRRTERRAKWKPLRQRTFSHACPACPFAQRLAPFEKSLAPVFRDNSVDGICPENPYQQLRSFSLAPCQRSYACPMAQGLETLAGLGRTVFRNNRIDEICLLKNPCQQQCIFSVAPCQRNYACPIAQRLQTTWKVLGAQFFGTMALSWKPELSPSYFPRFPLRPPCRRFRLAPSPRKLSPSYFPRFPFPPPCHRFHLAPGPSQRSSPQAISHGFPSVHPLSPSYFPWLAFRPPSGRFRIAPSPRSSPQAISHGFPSVHPLITSVSLPRGKCN